MLKQIKDRLAIHATAKATAKDGRARAVYRLADGRYIALFAGSLAKPAESELIHICEPPPRSRIRSW